MAEHDSMMGDHIPGIQPCLQTLRQAQDAIWQRNSEPLAVHLEQALTTVDQAFALKVAATPQVANEDDDSDEDSPQHQHLKMRKTSSNKQTRGSSQV